MKGGARPGLLAARAAAILLLVAAGVLLAPRLGLLLDQVAALGPWAPFAFVLVYAVSTVLLVPGSLMTLAAGLLFGFLEGGLLAFAGSCLGSVAAFLISRHFARGVVERRLAGKPVFARIDRAVGADGLKIVFLLRLAPLFPFVLLNYALGLTRVRVRDYLLASLGMLPGAFLYAYYGRALGSLAALADGADVERGAEQWVFLAAGLAAAVAAGAALARIAGKALREAPEMDGPASAAAGEDDG